jgi:uncharacterized GH25 family protein
LIMTRLLPSLLIVVLAALAAGAQKQQPQKAVLQILVVKDASGKPVKNAEVILHPVSKDGGQKQEGLELKTHDDGKADIAGIRYGKLRIQVIAQGYRTFGKDFVINQPTMEITIKLEKPADQFSIYK